MNHLPLTPETLEAAYEYLCTTPPFKVWNLPPGDEVTFRVTRSPDTKGYYQRKKGRHIIAVSSRCVGQTATLFIVMAHEMTHLHQAVVGMETPGAIHNEAFWKLTARVCRVHGFDPKLF